MPKPGKGGDDMFNTAVSSTEHDYQVFDIKEIITKQQQEVEKISDILGISHSSARVLLRKFGKYIHVNMLNVSRMETRSYHEYFLRKRVGGCA
jgi:hypothetical protein